MDNYINSISKYLTMSPMPRYYFPYYNSKAHGDREIYDEAKKIFNLEDFRSNLFVEHATNIAKVLRFDIDSKEVHPKYADIVSKANDLIEECIDLYGDDAGVWYITRENSMSAKEKKALKQACKIKKSITSYSIYCGNEFIGSTACEYKDANTEEASRLKKLSAGLIDLVLQAPWLPKQTWSTIVFSEVNSEGVFVMGRNMSMVYLESVINGHDPEIKRKYNKISEAMQAENLRIENERRKRVQQLVEYDESKDLKLQSNTGYEESLSPEKEDIVFQPIKTGSSMSCIKNTITQRREIYQQVSGANSKEEILRRVTSRKPSFIFGDRFCFNIDPTLSPIKLRDKYILMEFALKKVNENFFKPFFWSNIPPEIAINSFPVNNEKSHPDFIMIQNLCSEITDLIHDMCYSHQIGSIWYLKKNTSEDAEDAYYDKLFPEDSTKYNLYCDYYDYGYIRAAYCNDGLEHSDLEVKLAQLVYILSSIPWLGYEYLDNIVLPCSGITRKEYGSSPVVVSDRILKKLRHYSIKYK